MGALSGWGLGVGVGVGVGVGLRSDGVKGWALRQDRVLPGFVLRTFLAGIFFRLG